MADKFETNPWTHLEDVIDPSIPTFTLEIYKWIDENFKRKDNNVLRASAANMCIKRRWYQGNGVEGKPLTPRKIVNFMMGDLAERTMQFFVKKALENKLYSEVSFGDVVGKFTMQGKEIELYDQPDWHIELSGLPVIVGHPDGKAKRLDGTWELIEFKSASSWGFKSFKEEGPTDYLKQVHALMMTKEAQELKIDTCRFFYLRKETGQMWDRVIKFDPNVAEEVKKEFMASVNTNEPKAPFELMPELVKKSPTGRWVAQFPCSYCSYLEQCHGKHEVEFKSDMYGHLKPNYVFKENKNGNE